MLSGTDAISTLPSMERRASKVRGAEDWTTVLTARHQRFGTIPATEAAVPSCRLHPCVHHDYTTQ